jgi:hypothetical protein
LAYHGARTGRRFGDDLRLRNTKEGQIVILRKQRILWRSSGTYKNEGGSLAFGPGLFAFSSYRRGVFLTDLRHPERVVVPGGGLHPLDFTDDGKLIVVGRGLVWVVSPEGAMLHRYRYSRPFGLGFDANGDLLYFVTVDGTLARADGGRARRLGPAPSRPGWLTVTEPDLLVWQGQHHVTVTRRDGALVASASWPATLGSSDSGVVPSDDGKLFAYRVTAASAGASSARAGLFLLRSGHQRADLVLREELAGPIGCGLGVQVSWHGGFLLYGSGDGDVRVLEPSRGRIRVNLSNFARSLPKQGRGDIATVAWESEYSA